jgi:ribose 5-phosphate isomerase B
VIDQELALEIVRLWSDTPFEGGRHLPRIRKIDDPGYAQ